MNVVKSYQDIVREQIDNGSTNAGKKYRDSIRPIYGSEDNGRPVHIGTCVLVEIRGCRYLITAAHVIDESQYTTLYLGADRLVQIEGEFLCTTKPNNDRNQDHYDFGWQKLSQAYLERLKKVRFIEEADISRNIEATEGKAYVAMGFPNSKNKKVNIAKKSITPKFAKYTATGKSKPELFKKLDITGQDHITIDHDKKYSRNPDGSITNSIRPRGMSGGALIDIGRLVTIDELRKTEVHPGFLAGILIEKHDEFNSMLSVKIDVVIEDILRHV
jgi:hypothetical protein